MTHFDLSIGVVVSSLISFLLVVFPLLIYCVKFLQLSFFCLIRARVCMICCVFLAFVCNVLELRCLKDYLLFV